MTTTKLPKVMDPEEYEKISKIELFEVREIKEPRPADYFIEDIDDLVVYLKCLAKLNPDVGYLSAIKLQKVLYLLFAYYGAFYGYQKFYLKEFETIDDYVASYYLELTGPEFKFLPDELFPAVFEGWATGPVIASVHEKVKRGFYDDRVNSLYLEVTNYENAGSESTSSEPATNPIKSPLDLFEEKLFKLEERPENIDVRNFVKGYFLTELLALSDFVLVQTVKLDRSFRDVYGDGEDEVEQISNREIIDEYRVRVVNH